MTIYYIYISTLMYYIYRYGPRFANENLIIFNIPNIPYNKIHYDTN